MPYRLTTRAEADLLDISVHTAIHWGSAQALRYASALEAVFDRIGRDPHCMGSKPREDLATGVRSVIVEQHLVLYRPRDEQTDILRVLHQRMNPALHKLM